MPSIDHALSWTAFVILGSLFASIDASADSSIHLYANVTQNYESSQLPPLVNRDETDAGPGQTTVDDTVTLSSSGPSARTAGSATAVATEGSLWIRTGGGALVMTGHFDSQGNAYMPSQGASADTEARASWADTVTISDPSRTGQPGSAVALLQIGGSVGATRAPFVNIQNPDGGFLFQDTRGYGRVSVAGNGLAWPTQSWDDGCAAVGWAGWLACAGAAETVGGAGDYVAGSASDIPVVLDFIFGQPFQLTYTLYSNSGGNASTSYYKMSGSGNGSGDGLATLDWGGISEVLDGSGNLVVGYQVSSESGFDYVQPAPVPEPTSGIMLLAGLASLRAMRARPRS